MSRGPVLLEVEFDGQLWYWRGPAPWYFVTVPDDESDLIAEEASTVSYGWGMVPATARIGTTEWVTSLTPRDGRYVLPIKAEVRRREHLDEGDHCTVRVTLHAPT